MATWPRGRQFMRVRSETSTNATTHLYKHKHMRAMQHPDKKKWLTCAAANGTCLFFCLIGGSKFPGSQLVRDLWIDRDRSAFVQKPNYIMRLFRLHAGIEHLRVDWNNHSLILFADMEANDPVAI